MLLAIKAVLLFTYTSCEIIIPLIYNLLSFVHGAVYKNDTPERIFSFNPPPDFYWFSSSLSAHNARLVLYDGQPIGTHWANQKQLYQRPVLFLNKL